MSIRLSLALIIMALLIVLTHLFDTNTTARGYIATVAHKVGISAGNYVSNQPVCPQGYMCTAK